MSCGNLRGLTLGVIDCGLCFVGFGWIWLCLSWVGVVCLGLASSDLAAISWAMNLVCDVMCGALDWC